MNTSWQKVSKWYNSLVEDKGHFYHQEIIIPKSLSLLNLNSNSSVLDLGCGQGVLARAVPKNVYHHGIDIAPTLIDFAKKHDKNPLHRYLVGDITRSLLIEKKDFSHAAIILALQNVESPKSVLQNASQHLARDGKVLIVLNHPAFRIPRQSSWGVDPANKIQYRRINRYLSPLKIPIIMHPGMKNSPLTWSFHFPLSSYSQFLQESGFVIEKIEEWTSPKKSVGRMRRTENLSRNEIPLFLALLAQKM